MAASSIATRSGAGMLTVASVFKSGGTYFPKYVRVLRDAVRRNLTIPHRFVCLTDVDVPCERIPLIHGWPSFYSKIELFRPGLFDGPAWRPLAGRVSASARRRELVEAERLQ